MATTAETEADETTEQTRTIDVLYLPFDGGESRYLRSEISCGETELTADHIRDMYEYVGRDDVHVADPDADLGNDEFLLATAYGRWQNESGVAAKRQTYNRSLSVGDVILVDETAYVCDSIGFAELDDEAIDMAKRVRTETIDGVVDALFYDGTLADALANSDPALLNRLLADEAGRTPPEKTDMCRAGRGR